jgi:hypothetical protein
MSLFTQHLLRLLLIIAMVLLPVQGAFAVHVDMHTDILTVAATDIAHDSGLSMSEDGCSNCQGFTQCGSCPVSLGISQFTPIRYEVVTQIHVATLGVPLSSADFLPEYRPPRYS